MKRLRCSVIGLIVLFLGNSVVFAENELELELTFDYFGKYIWRGQNLSDDPVFQPGASLGWNGFTLGWWGNINTTKINDLGGKFTEHDWSLDYSGDLPFDLPFVEDVGYSVGVINYYFPTLDDAGETTEVYWGLNFDLPLSPSFTIYHDVDEIKGTYASFGIGHSIEKIAELTPDIPIGMDIGASLGWGSRSYNNGYWGDTVNSDEFNDLALSLSFPFEIAGWSIAPSLNYVTLVNSSIRKTDAYASGGNKASDYFFMGIGIAKSF